MTKAVTVVAMVMWARIIVGTTAQETCYAFNNNPYLNFADKTSYEHAYDKNGIPAVADCTPVQLWLVSRHGTRWPTTSEITELSGLFTLRDQIISNYDEGNVHMCIQDLENLKAWTFNVTADEQQLLTVQGREDLYELGSRVRSYFPQLFNTSYSADKFVFRYTDTPRTKESAEYFYRGVFGLAFDSPEPTLPTAIPNDPLIRPYNNCTAWYPTVSTVAKGERAAFYETEYMTSVIYNVSRRLGFYSNLTDDTIDSIYDGCRYQKAWNVSSISPWCAAFTKEELEILEYSEDVKYYYETGPGEEMNLRLACPLVKDMVTHFSDVESEPEGDHPTAYLYFTHSTMLDMLSARLALTQDTLPLTSQDFPDEQDRQFRSSHIIPFAGNLLAVLYNCTEEDNSTTLRTAFYLAEEKVDYPGCSDGICDWSYIKQNFSTFVDNSSCTNTSFCGTASSALALYARMPLGVLLAVMSLVVSATSLQ